MKKNFLKMAIMMWFISCAEQSNTSELIVAAAVEPSDLKPYTINEGHAYKVRWQIFDRLITSDPKGNLLPGLATEWKLIDPTTIELKIRQEVTFHNGDFLTIQDVKYSIDQAISVSTLKSTLGVFKDSKIIDKETIQVTLFEPNASAFALFSASGFLVSSEKSMKASENGDPSLAYNGTGPFKFVEWNRGQNIILERNNEYWDTLANVEKVNYRIIPDASVRMISVETGEIDIAYDIDGADRVRSLNDNKIIYIENKGSRMDYLGLNVTKEPFNNKKVRQAVAYALDISGMIDSVMFGSAEQARSVIGNSILYSDPNIPKRNRNIEKSKALLKESGIAEGTKITLWTMEGFRRKLAEVIQANLNEVGLDVSIEVYEWATYVESLSQGVVPMFLLAWTTNPLDADAGIFAILHSSSRGPGGNYMMYQNEQLDEYLDMGRNNNDPNVRREVYKKTQELIFEEVPLIPLFYLYDSVATTKNIENFVLNSFAYHELKYPSKK